MNAAVTALLIIVPALAVWLAFPSPRAPGHRARRALHGAGGGYSAADGRPRSRRRGTAGGLGRWRGRGRRAPQGRIEAVVVAAARLGPADLRPTDLGLDWADAIAPWLYSDAVRAASRDFELR